MRYKKHKLVYKTYIAQNNNVQKKIYFILHYKNQMFHVEHKKIVINKLKFCE